MKAIVITAFCLMGLAVSLPAQDPKSKPEPETEQEIDLTRYKGVWYEIGRLPNRFEKDLVGVTAIYTLNKNGTLKVTNQGFKGSVYGKQKRAKGHARVVDYGKLKVYFAWPFGGDYWILDLDPNYQYALVGSPDMKYLWVLSRKPTMDNNTYNKLLSKAKNMGYATEKMEMPDQIGLPIVQR